MTISPNNIYHIYNQGNNRQTIFLRNEDYIIFLNLYKKLVFPYSSTIAWCLMPNHFHFMIYADERCDLKIKQGGIFIDPVTNGFRKLLSGYARIFNNQNQRSGSLFRQKTKSKSLSEITVLPGDSHTQQDYFVNCFNYIHQNPVTAKLADRIEDWEFSSFKDYAGLRDGKLCQKELGAKYCNYEPGTFLSQSSELVEQKMIGFFK